MLDTIFCKQLIAHIIKHKKILLNEKQKMLNGEIYNPEFIGTMFRLTQKGSNQSIAFAIDLETLELIWMDTPMKCGNYCVVAAANGGVVLSLKDALKKHMNLYDFFKLHSNHITLVDDKEDADIIISDSDDATLKPYDVETISAHWL